ncbi:hypothetical protein QP866_06650 [Corynebacterium imitans]|uniref:hypothetical protein n=1 Tax=Corynebacterium imitans TaxID=156978 RepID=UPI00254E0CAD|nr:hypothetical protein [Corynebacterium imitans]MDK8637505.1 hypothetical protein [Corynebacterium imitans]MDK8772067.1 hypothetical protein [Corynebacterium imitans]
MTDFLNRAVREVLTALDDDDCKTGVCAIAAGAMTRNGYDVDARSVAAGVSAAFAKCQQDLYLALGADILNSPEVDAFADESTDVGESNCLASDEPCDECESDEGAGRLFAALLSALIDEDEREDERKD